MNVSLVLTDQVASKNLSVTELVSLGRQPYTNWLGTLTQKDISKIESAINMVDLMDLKNRKCYQLSDGQLQRALIARALAQDTPIMLLDEPTTHLDLHHKATVIKLLKSIANETSKTILFTTHEIELAIQMCDKMLILKKSNNQFGTPESLITNAHFDNLFPSETIVFDSKTGSFRVKK